MLKISRFFLLVSLAFVIVQTLRTIVELFKFYGFGLKLIPYCVLWGFLVYTIYLFIIQSIRKNEE